MGLFCQLLHVYDVDQKCVQKSLEKVLSKHGYSLVSSQPISGAGAGPQVDISSAPAYIIGPQLGRWTPIIDLYAEPWIGDICTNLSRACSSYVLALMVHDDDIMFYNLDQDGASLDGYNSNPQYFEKKRLGEPEIQSHLHTPEPFELLLPSRKTVNNMLNILNAGWWRSHDSGRLNDDGVMIEEDRDLCPYKDEGERMTALGTFLELAGPGIAYPFTDWLENKNINWPKYKLHQYRRKPGILRRIWRSKT